MAISLSRFNTSYAKSSNIFHFRFTPFVKQIKQPSLSMFTPRHHVVLNLNLNLNSAGGYVFPDPESQQNTEDTPPGNPSGGNPTSGSPGDVSHEASDDPVDDYVIPDCLYINDMPPGNLHRCWQISGTSAVGPIPSLTGNTGTHDGNHDDGVYLTPTSPPDDCRLCGNFHNDLHDHRETDLRVDDVQHVRYHDHHDHQYDYMICVPSTESSGPSSHIEDSEGHRHEDMEGYELPSIELPAAHRQIEDSESQRYSDINGYEIPSMELPDTNIRIEDREVHSRDSDIDLYDVIPDVMTHTTPTCDPQSQDMTSGHYNDNDNESHDRDRQPQKNTILEDVILTGCVVTKCLVKTAGICVLVVVGVVLGLFLVLWASTQV